MVKSLPTLYIRVGPALVDVWLNRAHKPPEVRLAFLEAFSRLPYTDHCAVYRPARHHTYLTYSYLSHFQIY